MTKGRRDPTGPSKDDGSDLYRLAGSSDCAPPAKRQVKQDPGATLREWRAKNDWALRGFLAARIQSDMDEAAELAETVYARVEPLLQGESIQALSQRVWQTAAAVSREVRALREAQEADGEPIPPQHPPGSPEDLCHRRRVQLLEDAVDQLPPKARLAFTLRIQQRLCFSEVAHQMGIEEQEAMQYVAQALRSCWSYLNGSTEKTSH